jgi:hypothetical protein
MDSLHNPHHKLIHQMKFIKVFHLYLINLNKVQKHFNSLNKIKSKALLIS